MGQLYLQRFEYAAPVSKAEFEAAWGEALQTFARSGKYHNQTYGRIARISWEPLFDMDAAFGPVVSEIRSRTR